MAKKIKVALSLLSGLSYGGLTYFNNLVPALARIDRSNEYHLFVPAGHGLISKVRQDNMIFHEIKIDPRLSFCRHLWEQLVLPFQLRKYRIDILFTAKNAAVFFAPCKVAISIRNMEPLNFRRYRNDWRLDLFSWMRWVNTVLSLKRADAVVAVSQAVKECVVRVDPACADKTAVIYNGTPQLEPADPSAVPAPVGQPYVLTASKIVAYANQLNLIKGYALLCALRPETPQLWLAGGILDRTYHRKIMKAVRDSALDGRVRFLGLIPHASLSALYSRARAFVFPSTLEACPQTLLEAMANGLAIASSKSPPMPEICGQAAVYFDPDDPKDIAEKLGAVLYDGQLRDSLIRAGADNALRYTWDATASGLADYFVKISQK